MLIILIKYIGKKSAKHLMFVLLLDQDKKCRESSEFLSRLQLAAKELPLVGYPPCPAA